MADPVHFAFLRNGRFTAYCNGAEGAVVTWSTDQVTCPKCRTRRMMTRIIPSDAAMAALPVECRVCDAVASPGEKLACGHYRIPGYLHRA